MDSPVITQISKWLETAKILHLEPTDVCQAACPLCARETDVNFNKLQKNYITFETIKEILGISTIKNLRKMFMCGNYGDPAASKETLNIYNEFKNLNPSIELGMNTNGGLQTSEWWQELAFILNKPNDYVVFSIDGLENTNHIYRKNVSWKKLIDNAKSFIKSGGNAHWDMLVYSYNQHQVKEAENLAKTLGFKWFRCKISKRSSNIAWLQPMSAHVQLKNTQNKIDCFRDKEQSIYLDCKGNLYPCCWLGVTNDKLDQFDFIRSSWGTDNCNPMCKKTCSLHNNTTNYKKQWQYEVEF